MNKAKWRAFDALLNAETAVDRALDDKTIVEQPVLSEEQIDDICEKIKVAFEGGLVIKFTYYSNNRMFELTGRIKKVDHISKRVILEDKKNINFNSIIKVDV